MTSSFLNFWFCHIWFFVVVDLVCSRIQTKKMNYYYENLFFRLEDKNIILRFFSLKYYILTLRIPGFKSKQSNNSSNKNLGWILYRYKFVVGAGGHYKLSFQTFHPRSWSYVNLWSWYQNGRIVNLITSMKST